MFSACEFGPHEESTTALAPRELKISYGFKLLTPASHLHEWTARYTGYEASVWMTGRPCKDQ